MPEPIRLACGDLMENVSVDPGQAVDGNHESRVYTDLQHCIDQQLVCEIEYQSPVEGQPLVTTL